MTASWLRYTSLLSLSALLFLLVIAVSQTAAQENNFASETNEIIQNNATSSDEVETDPLPDFSNPYPTEALLGDKVFDDFVLGPGKLELQLLPGQTKTVYINISNRMAETKRFEIDVEDISGSTDINESVVLLGDDRGPYTLKDYISVPKYKFDLEPNLRVTIPVTVSVPKDAEAGGKYGSVLVKTVTTEADPGSEDGAAPRSAIISRIGSLIFVTVPGETEIAGELKSFSTLNNKKWYEKGPIEFQILYENEGSLHLNPYGEIRISNVLGEDVGFVELKPWFALPQSLRSREISWNRDLLFGRYTATLNLNRGYDDIIDEAQISFWVIPWKIVATIFVGLFVVIWFIMRFFKSFEFKRKEK